MSRTADDRHDEPGVLGRGCDPSAPGGCALCGDEALPARVLAVDAVARTAGVVFLTGGRPPEVALDLVDDISIGDVVLVHQGFVISRVGTP